MARLPAPGPATVSATGPGSAAPAASASAIMIRARAQAQARRPGRPRVRGPGRAVSESLSHPNRVRVTRMIHSDTMTTSESHSGLMCALGSLHGAGQGPLRPRQVTNSSDVHGLWPGVPQRWRAGTRKEAPRRSPTTSPQDRMSSRSRILQLPTLGLPARLAES